MTETPTEPTPAPTPLETVARLAAEAALRAVPNPEDRITALELQVGEILAALKAAAGPDGNAAKLGMRLEATEARLEQLEAERTKQETIDDMRQRVAAAEHKLTALERTP